jgi:pyridoxal phosphate enzyme (YggS family)
MSIAENLERVRKRIRTAAERSGRDHHDIELMAVSKTHPPELIHEAYQAGQRLFGENRVQEFAGKNESLRDLDQAEWRLIGHLQTNKAGKAAELFSAVESVDSLRLAQKLNAAAKAIGKVLGVLIEINIGGEQAKSGLNPSSPELEQILVAAPQFPNLAIRGLMTVPPLSENPEDSRPYFRRLRELRDEIMRRQMPGCSLGALSMGMSHDFDVAIEEGSTCVRVGTAIFGERIRNP